MMAVENSKAYTVVAETGDLTYKFVEQSATSSVCKWN